MSTWYTSALRLLVLLMPRMTVTRAGAEAESIEVADEETVAPSEEKQRLEPLETDAPMDADQLKEYLKGLDPEDFGRFTP